MSSPTKDTIYVDIDDDITGIVDKLTASDKKIVALVLPKRAAVLQSIVNMKLLRRTAESAKKNVVLITSEAGLLPLAGSVGLHVANNLNSKPAIPAAPEVSKAADAAVDATDALDASDVPLDPNKSVGELAGSELDDDEAIELDNTSDSPKSAPNVAAKTKMPKKDKKLKIPNFEKFRNKAVLGAAAVVVLVVGLYWALALAPKAKITIKSDSSTVATSVPIIASTTATELDPAANVVPAKLKQVKKTDTEKVAATGQKDIGAKASGTVTLMNCTDDAVTIPAGTGVSSSGLTFITQKAVALESGNFTGGHVCKTSGTHVGTVAVIAQKNGDQYNLPAGDYTVAGFSSVKASGGNMTGGVSKTVKVVSQVDLDTAKQKLAGRSDSAAKDELKKALQAEGVFVIQDSLVASEPTLTSSPKVGDEANDVTVTAEVTYSMLGVKEDDLKTLARKAAEAQIDTTKQKISDEGVHDASFQVTEKKPDSLKITMQTDVRIGVQPDAEKVKSMAAGKKKGEIINAVQNDPGVKEVNVSLSPFWVTKAPKNVKKITVVFEQQTTNAKP